MGDRVPVRPASAAAVVLWGLLALASLAFAAQEDGLVEMVGPMKREQILEQLESLKWRAFGDVRTLG